MVGKTISHYDVLEKIGAGGMGVVYKAKDTKLGRNVALKFLRPEALESEELKTRFLQEAEAAAALEHPNICMVFEIDEADGHTFLAMSFVDGDSLSEKIEQRPLKLNEALDIAIQTSEGLQAAHQKNIVHRDVKPGNIMIDAEGRVKIMDFGLAQLGKRTRITKSGTTLGTPAYMSPEQVEGKEVDRRSDIWSLGVVFFEMLTGRLPFEGDTEQAVSHKILYEEPEPPTALRGRLPMELDRIVEKALAKDPADRYQHADDLIVDLRKLKRQSESGILTQPAQVAPAPPTPIWKRWGVLGAVALVALTAVLVWILIPDGTAPAPDVALGATPLTRHPGLEMHPTLSPDGAQVAFSWSPSSENNHDIYVKVVGPGESVRRTIHPALDYSPAWSPDGMHIAFMRDLGQRKAGVFIMPAVGSSERQVATFRDPDLTGEVFPPKPHLAWTKDSERLIVAAQDPDSAAGGVFLVSTLSSEIQRLSPPFRGNPAFPTVSPDGGTVAFGIGAGPFGFRKARICRLPLAPDQEPPHVPSVIFEGSIGLGLFWGPEGHDLFFPLSQRLWRINALGGGQPQLVPSVMGGMVAPVVSHTSNRLVFGDYEISNNLWRVDLSIPVEARDRATRLASSSTGFDNMPRYSPSGQRIVYSSDLDGQQIFRCDRDGSNVVQLSPSPEIAGDPSWSPDGNRIAFSAWTGVGVQFEIYVMNADGGERRATGMKGITPSWSGDGSWIYAADSKSGIWKVSSEGGEAVQVTAPSRMTPIESPDGQFLYYVNRRKERSLWRVPVDGGEEVRVLDSVHARNYAVTAEGVYFIPKPTPGNPYEIRFHRFATEAIETIHRLEREPGQGMSISPDGRSLLYTQMDTYGGDLQIVEGFTF